MKPWKKKGWKKMSKA